MKLPLPNLENSLLPFDQNQQIFVLDVLQTWIQMQMEFLF